MLSRELEIKTDRARRILERLKENYRSIRGNDISPSLLKEKLEKALAEYEEKSITEGLRHLDSEDITILLSEVESGATEPQVIYGEKEEDPVQLEKTHKTKTPRKLRSTS